MKMPEAIKPENKKLEIVGGRTLDGEIRISGAKNAALPILAATLLASGSKARFRLHNVPRLMDVEVMLELLRGLGVAAVWRDKNTVELDAACAEPLMPDRRLVGSIRASNLLLGSLIGRFGEAESVLCGGCSIGRRPVDIHLNALKQMGVRFLPDGDGYFAFCRELHGAEIRLPFPSVGATENILMAAALGKGRTVIHNAAAEPEIADLAAFIRAMGGRIDGAGSDTVVIDGVRRLHGTEYEIMPDRIESGTFLLAGAMCGGRLMLRGAKPEHNEALLDVLRRAGVRFEFCNGLSNKSGNKASNKLSNKFCDSGIIVYGCRELAAVDVETAPYPGFPTDMQPQLAAMLTLARGRSCIRENIFENRLGYVEELKKMGAAIRAEGNCAVIDGVSDDIGASDVPGKSGKSGKLSGAAVTATDLRAGAALVLAGMAADGRTVIEHAERIDRGYEALDVRLRAVGADIRRV